MRQFQISVGHGSVRDNIARKLKEDGIGVVVKHTEIITVEEKETKM